MPSIIIYSQFSHLIAACFLERTLSFQRNNEEVLTDKVEVPIDNWFRQAIYECPEFKLIEVHIHAAYEGVSIAFSSEVFISPPNLSYFDDCSDEDIHFLPTGTEKSFYLKKKIVWL